MTAGEKKVTDNAETVEETEKRHTGVNQCDHATVHWEDCIAHRVRALMSR